MRPERTSREDIDVDSFLANLHRVAFTASVAPAQPLQTTEVVIDLASWGEEPRKLLAKLLGMADLGALEAATAVAGR
jgi:hypothetical protein